MTITNPTKTHNVAAQMHSPCNIIVILKTKQIYSNAVDNKAVAVVVVLR
ncbi:MAG: hypothetical protein P0116_08450 [Candidatus Nitrosocosmicus sp.]|nr:hypothetical protein [Candidatus Nitrosocosmicus sp.]